MRSRGDGSARLTTKLTANEGVGMPVWVRLRHETEEATASGLYGLIVGAAVLVASHAATAVRTVIAVLGALTIYWLAERYTRIVAERIHAGHRPAWETVRRQLTTGWEMITASTLPLLVLIAVRLAGVSLETAAISALVCTTGLLCLAGWRIGSGGRLHPLERLVSTLVAGTFGMALITLKTLLH